jgi:hypothetical protein
MGVAEKGGSQKGGRTIALAFEAEFAWIAGG